MCLFVFDSSSKENNDNIPAAGTAALLKFESLSLLENYITSVYYANYPMTLQFQIHSGKLYCRCKKEDLELYEKTMKRKYHDNSGPNRQIQNKNSLNILSRKLVIKKKYPKPQKEYEYKKNKQKPGAKREYEKKIKENPEL